MVTHNIEEAVLMADRIVIMEKTQDISSLRLLSSCIIRVNAKTPRFRISSTRCMALLPVNPNRKKMSLELNPDSLE